ncbi:MAG: serine protease [Spirochaetales bacterium]|nr:serine protease [Spirochaetales bacterium]
MKRALCSCFLFLVISSLCFAELRDSIALVRPHFFLEFTQVSRERATLHEGTLYHSMALGLSHLIKERYGSGICLRVPGDDENLYVLTSGKLLRMAQSVDVTFLDRAGQRSLFFKNTPIVAVSEKEDLALLRLEGGDESKLTVLKWESMALQEGSEIWVSGFGEADGGPEWHLAQGKMLSSTSLTSLKGEGRVEHDSPIAGPFGGGALLVRQSDGTFVAVGMMLSASRGSEGAQALLEEQVMDFVTHAATGGFTQKDALTHQVNAFVQGMMEQSPEKLQSLMSDQGMMALGWRSALQWRGELMRDERQKWDENFLHDSSQMMRAALIHNQVLPEVENSSGFSLEVEDVRITNSDRGDGILLLNGERVLTHWVLEQGMWRLLPQHKTRPLLGEGKAGLNVLLSGFSMVYRQGAGLGGKKAQAPFLGGEITLAKIWPKGFALYTAFGGGHSVISNTKYLHGGALWLDGGLRFQPLAHQGNVFGFIAPYLAVGAGFEWDFLPQVFLLRPQIALGSDFQIGHYRDCPVLNLQLGVHYPVALSSPGLYTSQIVFEPRIGLAFP